MSLPMLTLSTRWGLMVNTVVWPLYAQERDPVNVQETGWASRLVSAGVENLAPTRFGTSNCVYLHICHVS
jgi:hypothetical protein